MSAPTCAGTVLILVAGISALLASLAVAFLVRQRASSEESAAFERDIQARIMLVAGCSYIQETSRIGYDDGSDAWHREAFGWIDVRQLDTSGAPLLGPNCRGTAPTDSVPLFTATLQDISGLHGQTKDRPWWPAVGGVARCPMYVMERPPYAIQLTAAYNPIVADPASPAFGKPYLANPDPMPVVANPGGGAAARLDFVSGKPDPRPNSNGRAWFRAFRDGPATFVITCGSGGTAGFASWNEVLGAGATAQFGGDSALFAALLEQETRLWYRVEWSPAVATSEVHNIKNAWNDGLAQDYYVSFPMNSSQSIRSQSHPKNMGGTFRYIERLRMAPTRY
jgi:hypothetical protein